MRSTFTILVLVQVSLHVIAFLVAWGLERTRLASALRRGPDGRAADDAVPLPARRVPAPRDEKRRREVGAFRAST